MFPWAPLSSPPPQNKFQAWLFDLVTSWCFEVFMVVVICLNMVILMVETEEQSEQKEEILFWFHFVIIVIFLIEFILKIITLRKFYFSDCYNIIDFLVIFVSIIGRFSCGNVTVSSDEVTSCSVLLNMTHVFF